MEIGATMELGDGKVNFEGRRTPLYSGGNNLPVAHHLSLIQSDTSAPGSNSIDDKRYYRSGRGRPNREGAWTIVPPGG